jgi:hypothetical protein
MTEVTSQLDPNTGPEFIRHAKSMTTILLK